MIVVEQVEIMELLYSELTLQQEVEELRDELKQAGANLKTLGEYLVENPDLVFPPDWPVERLPENGIQVNLIEYKRLYDFYHLGEKLRALHEKAAELQDVQKRLYICRAKKRKEGARNWLVRRK